MSPILLETSHKLVDTVLVREASQSPCVLICWMQRGLALSWPTEYGAAKCNLPQYVCKYPCAHTHSILLCWGGVGYKLQQIQSTEQWYRVPSNYAIISTHSYSSCNLWMPHLVPCTSCPITRLPKNSWHTIPHPWAYIQTRPPFLFPLFYRSNPSLSSLGCIKQC